ncbi:Bug family tripartite tricarboxylate transporter substrate binding protein [Pararoseomonas indoligenes]|uniref:Twin-arginine translocation pathway signal protein n=1 Tax=Roseomonas indoligenes TaxID=2820811 RepID=A0A940N2W6_9PROT|nr:tripartite tricarboxylate transporter substrate-binding protein [Pararoseomonas indoligenes]MBP0495737.1 twin-arginine translocation pathway signal protein [Pararoseomonas indoligenes]
MAQSWPSRPIRMMVGFAPGGAADTIARLVAPGMGAALGQTVVVENRSGASGTNAAGAVAASVPDGHTVLLSTLSHLSNPYLFNGLSFDYATAFAPVSQVVLFPTVLAVRKDFPARTIAEFLALARGRQEPITYGTPGNATAQHMAGELFQIRTGLRLEHVPYRGGADAARDLAAGVIETSFNSVGSLSPAFGAGARALVAVTPSRIPGLPEVPTGAEAGIEDFTLSDICGVYAPAATPPDRVERLQQAIAAALATEEVRARLRSLEAEGVGSTPAEFSRFNLLQGARLGTLIRAAGIKLS